MRKNIAKALIVLAALTMSVFADAIESNMGYCTILNVKRYHQIIAAQVQCRIQGGQMILGDIIFRLRDDGAIDFEDQDHTSSAVLHKCAE